MRRHGFSLSCSRAILSCCLAGDEGPPVLPMIAASRRVEGIYFFYPENGDEPEHQK